MVGYGCVCRVPAGANLVFLCPQVATNFAKMCILGVGAENSTSRFLVKGNECPFAQNDERQSFSSTLARQSILSSSQHTKGMVVHSGARQS